MAVTLARMPVLLVLGGRDRQLSEISESVWFTQGVPKQRDPVEKSASRPLFVEGCMAEQCTAGLFWAFSSRRAGKAAYTLLITFPRRSLIAASLAHKRAILGEERPSVSSVLSQLVICTRCCGGNWLQSSRSYRASYCFFVITSAFWSRQRLRKLRSHCRQSQFSELMNIPTI